MNKLASDCFLIALTVISITEKTSKIMLSTARAGKATLWHFMVIFEQPPMRKWGMARAIILAKKMPIRKPKFVLGSVKTIMQAPNATISNPIPISACADQLHIGIPPAEAEGAQQSFCAGSAQQSSSAFTGTGSSQQSSAFADDDDAILYGLQTLNRNCGPRAMRNPSNITTELKIIVFFMNIP